MGAAGGRLRAVPARGGGFDASRPRRVPYGAGNHAAPCSWGSPRRRGPAALDYNRPVIGPTVPPVAIFGSLAISEVVLIGAVALMIFGGRLPEVVMRGAAQLMRARKVVTRMWREAGLEQELRRVQWEIERNMPRDADFDLRPSAARPSGAASAAARPLAAKPLAAAPGAGTEDAPGSGSAATERLDPAVGFGAPSGTVAVGPEHDAPRGPDPPPRPPDVPPRDADSSPPAEDAPPSGAASA